MVFPPPLAGLGPDGAGRADLGRLLSEQDILLRLGLANEYEVTPIVRSSNEPRSDGGRCPTADATVIDEPVAISSLGMAPTRNGHPSNAIARSITVWATDLCPRCAGRGRSRLRAASPDDVRHSRTYRRLRRGTTRAAQRADRAPKSARQARVDGRGQHPVASRATLHDRARMGSGNRSFGIDGRVGQAMSTHSP